MHPFTEIVPPPERGRAFEGRAQGALADCAPDGRVRLDALARWLQDVAYADVEDAGVAEAGLWVVRRTRLRVERFPRFRERVALRTFGSSVGRVWAERRTSLRGDGGARAEAAALWVFVDPTGRPLTLDEAMDPYRESAGDRRVSPKLRQPPPPDTAERAPWHFRFADLDFADHVNNAAYWEPVEEWLAPAMPPALDAELEHRAPAPAGDATLLTDGPALWIADADGAELHASAIARAL